MNSVKEKLYNIDRYLNVNNQMRQVPDKVDSQIWDQFVHEEPISEAIRFTWLYMASMEE